MLQWFEISSYLLNRTQRVVLTGQNSEWVTVKAGVPQGSILGILLFLLYNNDIVNRIKTKMRFFADDTSLFIIVDTTERATGSLNSDLQEINQWATEWLVDFNPSQTFTMTVSRKTTDVLHPPLFLAGTKIQETDTYKHLGIHFSNNLSWTDHIRTISRTAWQNMLRGLKFRLKQFSLEHLSDRYKNIVALYGITSTRKKYTY